MALTPLATVADLEVRLGVPVGSLAGADLARAQSNLTDVSLLVRSEGDETWGVPDPLTTIVSAVPEVAVMVTTQAALRAYRNPDGFAGENIGGAYSYTYGPGAQNGVYLNAEEVRLVRGAAGLDIDGKPKGFVGTIRTPSSYEAGGERVLYVGIAGEPQMDPVPFVVVV